MYQFALLRKLDNTIPFTSAAIQMYVFFFIFVCIFYLYLTLFYFFTFLVYLKFVVVNRKVWMTFTFCCSVCNDNKENSIPFSFNSNPDM